jgi:hypothetical protein
LRRHPKSSRRKRGYERVDANTSRGIGHKKFKKTEIGKFQDGIWSPGGINNNLQGGLHFKKSTFMERADFGQK